MELSKEMKKDLVNGLNNDAQRMIEQTQKMHRWVSAAQPKELEYTSYDIDSLVYITEEMRLKLKLLGGARIYEL